MVGGQYLVLVGGLVLVSLKEVRSGGLFTQAHSADSSWLLAVRVAWSWQGVAIEAPDCGL